jgi:hypothetical protein
MSHCSLSQAARPEQPNFFFSADCAYSWHQSLDKTKLFKQETAGCVHIELETQVSF